jgi:hypothetical protein
MPIFEYWMAPDGSHSTTLPQDHGQHDFLTEEQDHIFSIKAASWDEAVSFVRSILDDE